MEIKLVLVIILQQNKMVVTEEYGFYTIFLAAIGALCVVFKLFDTIIAILQTVQALLAPYLLTEDPHPLTEKYGTWARQGVSKNIITNEESNFIALREGKVITSYCGNPKSCPTKKQDALRWFQRLEASEQLNVKLKSRKDLGHNDTVSFIISDGSGDGEVRDEET
ncbi:hypothetical protein FQA39_LY08542 [Lamprigera yunnana]|nr:hypothetical protein FQA39_LY08542 [Lamprigera yunnana]